MSAHHTPGPWQYAFEGGTTAFITEADGSTIICIRTTENTTAHENLAANARLIAAAPDLLAALEQSLMVLIGYQHQNEITKAAQNSARAAIAKARGES